MKSIWLREETDDDSGGLGEENTEVRMEQQKIGGKSRFGKIVDPILGLNLE